jgi:hypothetical protein
MKMKELKKIGLIGAAGFFASLSLFGGIGASAEVTPVDWSTPPADGEALTSSEVPTNLWCAWYVTGMDADVSLYPISGLEKSQIEDILSTPITDADLTEYDGSALELTGYSLGTEALVAGYVASDIPSISDRKDEFGDATSPDPYDCSWYNSEQGFTSTVSVDNAAGTNPNFVAFYGATPTADPGMDFGLTGSDDGIAITFIQDPLENCDDGFALALSATIEDADPMTTIEVASVLYSAELLTDLTCMWDTKFVVTMPSLLTPAAPGEKYSFTGPTLKTTVTLDGAPA